MLHLAFSVKYFHGVQQQGACSSFASGVGYCGEPHVERCDAIDGLQQIKEFVQLLKQTLGVENHHSGSLL